MCLRSVRNLETAYAAVNLSCTDEGVDLVLETAYAAVNFRCSDLTHRPNLETAYAAVNTHCDTSFTP